MPTDRFCVQAEAISNSHKFETITNYLKHGRPFISKNLIPFLEESISDTLKFLESAQNGLVAEDGSISSSNENLINALSISNYFEIWQQEQFSPYVEAFKNYREGKEFSSFHIGKLIDFFDFLSKDYFSQAINIRRGRSCFA